MNLMRNIKLVLEYNGSRYAGWQSQKNRLSIQDKIEECLRNIINEDVRLISAGRTDAGVHAKAQVANFKTSSALAPLKMKKALNALLPSDIRIRNIQEVNLDFHARYSAKRKIYRYYIYSGEVLSPFLSEYVWHLPLKLNFEVMAKEARFLEGRHNFSSFQAKGSGATDAVREVYRAEMKKRGFLYQFEIEANGFLYKMVRMIMGVLVEAGRGKFAPGIIPSLLRRRCKLKTIPTAPAGGLFLWRVIY